MSFLKNLSNSKEVLNSVDNSDLLIEVDEKLRSQVQHDLLEMYKDLLSVCEKYNITPYLIGGSALGAIRHKGFIPWDDDLDVGMTRSDYEKFKQIFKNELGKKYHLNAPNYGVRAKGRFPKIIKDGTLFQEIVDDKDPKECGLFLDIFILENVPDNKLHRLLKGLWCNALEFIGGQVTFFHNRDALVKQLYIRAGKSNYYMRLLIGGFFSFIPAYKWNNAIDKAVRYRDRKSKCCAIATGRKHYFGEILKKDKLFPAKYVTFENIEVPVFKDLDYYLHNLYGNYMKIPPIEKRERHFIKAVKL